MGGTACLCAVGGKISLVKRNIGTQLFIIIKSKLQNVRGIPVIARILVELFTAIGRNIEVPLNNNSETPKFVLRTVVL